MPDRIIIVETCEKCPFVEVNWGACNDKYPGNRYFCNHELNANAPEKIEITTIPDWCQLEIQGD